MSSSSRKRLLIYSTQMLPTGGIESHLRCFIQQFAAMGDIDIDLIVLRSLISDQQRAELQSRCGRSSFLRKWSLRTTACFGEVLCRSRFWPYDALYTNGQGESVDLIGSLVHAKRWVHHHHMAGDAADQVTWGPRYRSALGRADILVACSTTNALQMQDALCRQVSTVYCFSQPVLPRDRPTHSSKVLRLGYFGRLVPEKGVDQICRLSTESALSDIEFHIWGEGEQYPSAFFRDYPGVIYHGAFSDRNGLANAISTLDGLLLLSSHSEGLPISLLEAMSAGLPWMATDRGGIRDLVCDPKTTVLIKSLEDYRNTVIAVRQFADDLREGVGSRDTLRRFYRAFFSEEPLRARWREILFCDSSYRASMSMSNPRTDADGSSALNA